MQALAILAAAYQMFNPQVDIAHQYNNGMKRCVDYSLYESMAEHADVKMVAQAFTPNGTPIQFWVRPDKSWGVVLVEKIKGQSVACLYSGGTGWEEIDE